MEETYCTELKEWVCVETWCKLCELRTTRCIGLPCAWESNIYERRKINK